MKFEYTKDDINKSINTSYFDNTILMFLNEIAYALDLINEQTKFRISNDILTSERGTSME